MIDRSRKPVEQVDFSFHPPVIETFSLDSGLRVYFVKRSHLPVLRISLLIKGGSKYDPPEKKGLANLLTMTFDEGAGDLNGLELNDEFELLGSNFDSGCNHDTIFLSLRSLKENFDRSLELFSDVLIKPHLDDVSFAREKRKILTRVMQLKDDTDETADQVFESVLFGSKDPYSYPITGTEESIAGIVVEDIREYYHSFITPGNSDLIVIGDIDKETLTGKLNNAFRDWQNSPVKNITLPDAPPEDKTQTIYIVHKENALQTDIRLGHLSTRRNQHDYMHKLILNNILGGQFSSRLNLNLREKNGYTYGISSSFMYHKERGYFVISTSVAKQNTADALKEILNEVEGIKKGITPEELSFTRSSVMRRFPANFETNKQIAINVSRIVLHDLPTDHFERYLETVNSLTLEDINNAAMKYIHPEKLFAVLVGDKDILFDQLSRSGFLHLVELDHKGNEVN